MEFTMDIDNNDLKLAQLIASEYDEHAQKMKSFVSSLGISAFIKYLADCNLNINPNISLFKNKKIYNITDIADVNLLGTIIDIRTFVNSDALYIPKKHFENGIVPKYYVYANYDENKQEIIFKGYLKSDDVDKSQATENYYVCYENLLLSMENLIEELYQIVPVEQNYDCEAMQGTYGSFIDNELDNATEINIIKMLYTSEQCAKDFLEFAQFEFIAKGFSNFDDFELSENIEQEEIQDITENEEKVQNYDNTDLSLLGNIAEGVANVAADAAIGTAIGAGISGLEAGAETIEAIADGAEIVGDALDTLGELANSESNSFDENFEELQEVEELNEFDESETLSEDEDLNFDNNEEEPIEELAEETFDIEEENQDELINDDNTLEEFDEVEDLNEFDETENLVEESTEELEEETSENNEEENQESELLEDEAFDVEQNNELDDLAQNDEVNNEDVSVNEDLNLQEEQLFVDDNELSEDEEFDGIEQTWNQEETLLNIDNDETNQENIEQNSEDDIFSDEDLDSLQDSEELTESEDNLSEPEIVEENSYEIVENNDNNSEYNFDEANDLLDELESMGEDQPQEDVQQVQSDNFGINNDLQQQEHLQTLFDEKPQEEQVEGEQLSDNEYAMYVEQPKQKSSKNFMVPLLSVCVLSGLISGGVYYKLSAHKDQLANQDIVTDAQVKSIDEFDDETFLEKEANLIKTDVNAQDVLEADPDSVQPKDINQSMSDVFDDTIYPVMISKIAWEIPQNYTTSKYFKKYLQVTGVQLQRELQQNLASVSELSSNGKMKISFDLYSDNSLKNLKVIETSGSGEIDEIALKSLKNTLTYIKVPTIPSSDNFVTLTMVINF